MPTAITYNTGTGQVTVIQPSIDPSLYEGRNDVLILDDTTSQNESEALALKASVGERYLLVTGGVLVEMTAQQKADRDAADAAAIIAAAKAAAKAFQDSLDGLARLIRAVVKNTVEEINILRTRDRDRSADVAAATSLADLKTRWAARSELSDRTYMQAKNAINGQVDGE